MKRQRRFCRSTKLDELAQYLIEKETITGEEFMAILEKEGGAQ